MIKTAFFSLVMTLFLAGMVFFGVKSYQHALTYEKATMELVSYQSAQQQASLKLEQFAKHLLGGLYQDDLKKNLDQIAKIQQTSMQEAKRYTTYFMGLLLLSLVSYFFLSVRLFTLFGSLNAILTLVLGLITPILMVTIHKQVDYLGDIVLSFESKGVIGSIIKLFDSGDIVVALVILLFSVMIPVLKVFSLLVVSLFIESKFAHGLIHFFKMIGKWSMVDVFVVAVFLVYLTANKGDISRAEVEMGLYYFLAYVIVSMLVSLSANKMLQEKRSAFSV
ncbi:MAG: hypothetical protein RL113_762 [Pseudomonadota bacterium]